MRRRLWILALLALRARADRSRAARHRRPARSRRLAGAGGCVSQQTTLGCTAARGLDDARAVALSPDGAPLYAVAATPASVTAFGVDAQQRPAAAAQPLAPGASSRSPRPAAAPCARSRAPRRSPSRPTGSHVYVAAATRARSTSFARQPNGSLVQLAGIAGCTTDDATAGLRSRDRARAAPTRSRSRPTAASSTSPAAGRQRDHRLLARRGDRASAAARRRRRMPARGSRGLHPRHGPRRALGDRDRARRHLALRHLRRAAR